MTVVIREHGERTLTLATDETAEQRFRDCKAVAEGRMDVGRLTHAEFVHLLCDVYALHAEREDGSDDEGLESRLQALFGSEAPDLPESEDEMSIHNQPTSDILGRAVHHTDQTRLASGDVDGYPVQVSVSTEVDDGTQTHDVHGIVRSTHDDRDVRTQGKRTFSLSFSELFVADAVFEKLVRRYDLDEHDVGVEDRAGLAGDNGSDGA